ncbi:hypothetical protein BEL05_04865 [Shewanella colwelliana]|uniref:Uncharacterized protein n=1 Tax=Shewanella colwelliana TaxID=23 RepID=A0A1E5IP41_SHECO|nr:hypothetical protein [Shewanella colwelliana]OEG72312.1 hypothetical protein BEL05_04865 [Shewanella colwelliana]
MKKLTPEEALKVTKGISLQRERSGFSIADMDKTFVFASNQEANIAASKVKKNFDKTIKELANR